MDLFDKLDYLQSLWVRYPMLAIAIMVASSCKYREQRNKTNQYLGN